MKKWPKDNKLVSAEKLLSFVAESFRKGCTYKRKNNKDIPYEGYNVPCLDGLTFNPEEMLEQKQLEYGEKNQNRDILDVILMIAFSLGYEQGQRNVANNSSIGKILNDVQKHIEG